MDRPCHLYGIRPLANRRGDGSFALILCLKGMLIEQGIFGPAAPLKPALRLAYRNFTQWRQSLKISCSHKPFTTGGLICEGYGYFLASKGYNSRVLAEWVRHLLEIHRTDDPRHENALKHFNAITRYYALTERASRILFAGCMKRPIQRKVDLEMSRAQFDFDSEVD